ncbi:lipoate--protein ligase [Clostridium swellfunianum]|uniref:lipoate--protein ligase n=1 Tax=Clostridium swellfunianum TaxID=1367462 RepID=UPI0020303EA4|nr:lipoate--protein ligase [Clostridium swellfunianum]MCM0647511.1 lipoate--protein ligase [Clostridium swellfunianum]
MHKNFKIYISEVFDPKFNLSLEQWLMENNAPDEVVFFLWQNENTIVIGRNQNPYKECDIKKLNEDKVQLVRRLSGGGAVYHDLGNLNFTFIAAEENYNVIDNMSLILKGLSRFGIQGYFNGRNDLMVQDRKFSGNAFVSENGVSCHHGTLLVDVDLSKLTTYLTVSPLKLQSKGIDSVASRVVNLKEISKNITIDSLKEALIDSFNEFYETKAEVVALNEKTVDLKAYLEKYSSWQWNFSESPDFSISIEEKFPWGMLELYIEFSDGKIEKCRFFTDAIELEDFQSLERALENTEFKSGNIIEAIEKIINNEQIKLDLCSLISNKLQ